MRGRELIWTNHYPLRIPSRARWKIISHQTASWENHRLKRCLLVGHMWSFPGGYWRIPYFNNSSNSSIFPMPSWPCSAHPKQRTKRELFGSQNGFSMDEFNLQRLDELNNFWGVDGHEKSCSLASRDGYRHSYQDKDHPFQRHIGHFMVWKNYAAHTM